ncbi:DUF3418 domain-containing protein, partial [Enterobacter hormaechei subsp. steigerwaltii]|nr:DUF3418 domain-containing protein [Enterobacter hormaechei subsp. steigerwaltii]
NKKLIKEITELEHKSRKQDVLVDDEVLFAFYNERLPDFYTADAVSDDLHPTNPQQTAPSYAREERREGKTVASQTNFSATTANPLPNPLPQEGEQSAAASAVSNDPQPQKQPAPQKDRLKPLPLADIRTFQAWLKTAERENPRLLFLSRDDLMQHAAAHITEEQFPKFWQTADGKFELSYRFEPHHP